MIEFNPRRSAAPNRCVRIFGIGGAGANVLDRMVLDGVNPAHLVAANTDVQSLTSSVAGSKIQLGQFNTRGLGSGGDPEVGRSAAEEAAGSLSAAFDGVDVVFIVAGLGGGTGSGAAPVIAEMAQSAGAMVVSIVTLPFAFEGKRRGVQALEALEALQTSSSAVICFENDRMSEMVSARAGVQEAFTAADQVMGQCLQAISALLGRSGLMHLGFDDFRAALNPPSGGWGRSLFGYGEAEGSNRPYDALARALKNPLMDKGRQLRDCEVVMVHVSGGADLLLNEVQLLMEEFNRHVNDRTRILFGTAVDPRLSGRLTVTILSSLVWEEGSGSSEISSTIPALLSSPVPFKRGVSKSSEPFAVTPAPLRQVANYSKLQIEPAAPEVDRNHLPFQEMAAPATDEAEEIIDPEEEFEVSSIRRVVQARADELARLIETAPRVKVAHETPEVAEAPELVEIPKVAATPVPSKIAVSLAVAAKPDAPSSVEKKEPVSQPRVEESAQTSFFAEEANEVPVVRPTVTRRSPLRERLERPAPGRMLKSTSAASSSPASLKAAPQPVIGPLVEGADKTPEPTLRVAESEVPVLNTAKYSADILLPEELDNLLFGDLPTEEELQQLAQDEASDEELFAVAAKASPEPVGALRESTPQVFAAPMIPDIKPAGVSSVRKLNSVTQKRAAVEPAPVFSPNAGEKLSEKASTKTLEFKLPQQESLPFEPASRGRFEKSEPTMEGGQNLDVPTFLRKNVRIR